MEREWERITAGLPDLAQLEAPDETEDSGTDGDPGETHTPGAHPGAPSPSTPEPGAAHPFARRPPSSAGAQVPRLGEVPPGSAGPRDYEVPEDDEDEGYIPPEPPPIGATDPLPTLAWLMALGGPVLTVLLLIFWTTAPGWLYLSAVGASLVGWLVLFWRMPKGRSDSGDDNGAVL